MTFNNAVYSVVCNHIRRVKFVWGGVLLEVIGFFSADIRSVLKTVHRNTYIVYSERELFK